MNRLFVNLLAIKLRFATAMLALGCICLSSSVSLAAITEELLFQDIRYMAADLIDELVYTWKEQTPLAGKADLVLIDVTAPVGLDERFSIFAENRLYELLRLNQDIPMQLVYCSVCRQLVVKSTAKGTILSRGADQPEVLKGLADSFPDRIGLSLAFEAEKKDLVLRAVLFELKDSQKILWARTFSTALTAPRILRDSAPLVSLETARKQQRQILERIDPIEITTRLVMSSFSAAQSNISPPPLPFVEQSFEAVPLPKRNLRAGITLGFMSLRDSFEAWSFGGHAAKLLGRSTPSLVNPDYYLFAGIKYMRMRGPDADIFGLNQYSAQRILDAESEPKASLLFWRLGIETHIKFRMGALAFMEYSPQLKDSKMLKTDSLIGIPYHALGAGVMIRW